MSEPFADFDLLSLLAKGGMAEIFLARHRPTGGLVVVKRLLPELEDRPDVIELFLTEADVGSMLKHENVVPVLDAGEWEGRYYLVMEYADGVDAEALLSHAWTTRSPIPFPIVMRIGVDALRGLHFAHELTSPQGTHFGLVHRDVSPDNIFVTRAGIAKMADFGIAKLGGLESATSTGLLKGKLTYMSPEQVQAKTLDGRSDEFALALILYEMIAMDRPFAPRPGEGELEVMRRLQTAKMTRLKKAEPDCPRGVEAIISKALRHWRFWRFKTCGDFADALEEEAGGIGGLASREELAAYVDQVAAARANG